MKSLAPYSVLIHRVLALLVWMLLAMVFVLLVAVMAGCGIGENLTNDDRDREELRALLVAEESILTYKAQPIPPASPAVRLCLGPDMDHARRSVQVALDTWYGALITYTDLPIDPTREDFTSAVLHELGHQLGIRVHLRDHDAVMFAMLPGRGGAKRELQSADLAALPAPMPHLALNPPDSPLPCDLVVFWGDTTYTTSTGERIAARCLSLYRTIVCDYAIPWYFLR